MGGIGSGEKNGVSKTKTADHIRIDVLWMNRRGFLTPKTRGSLTWSQNDEEYSRIGYIVYEDSVRLVYNDRSNSVDMHIRLDWRNCRFGGKRPYLICPNLHCIKSVQHLYHGNPNFVCRHCLNLCYEVQNEPVRLRKLRKAGKLREKLGLSNGIANEPPTGKPKGMHWKTYDRLGRELIIETQLSFMELDKHIDRLFKQVGKLLLLVAIGS